MRDVDSIRGKSFTGFGDDEVVSAPTSPVKESIYIHRYEINNNSGSDATCGIGYKLLDADWVAGQWDDSAGASYTDDTTDAQDAGSDDFALTTTTNNDGFVVQADRPFSLVGITVSTAEAGSPVYEYSYWNGTAWTTFTPLVEPDFTGAGDTLIVFPEFLDWTALASGDTPVDTDGLTAGNYAIRVRATTAPSTAPLATLLWVDVALDLIGVVPTGASAPLDEIPGRSGDLKVPPGYSVVPICNQSSSKNIFSLEYFLST